MPRSRQRCFRLDVGCCVCAEHGFAPVMCPCVPRGQRCNLNKKVVQDLVNRLIDKRILMGPAAAATASQVRGSTALWASSVLLISILAVGLQPTRSQGTSHSRPGSVKATVDAVLAASSPVPPSSGSGLVEVFDFSAKPHMPGMQLRCTKCNMMATCSKAAYYAGFLYVVGDFCSSLHHGMVLFVAASAIPRRPRGMQRILPSAAPSIALRAPNTSL